MDAWIKAGKETDQVLSVNAEQMAREIKNDPSLGIMDVRKKSEYDSEHMINAENASLDYINDSMLKVDKNKTYFVHCAGGYRSMIFISVLKARGYNNLIDVTEGFKAIKATGLFQVTEYTCPSTLL